LIYHHSQGVRGSAPYYWKGTRISFLTIYPMLPFDLGIQSKISFKGRVSKPSIKNPKNNISNDLHLVIFILNICSLPLSLKSMTTIFPIEGGGGGRTPKSCKITCMQKEVHHRRAKKTMCRGLRAGRQLWLQILRHPNTSPSVGKCGRKIEKWW
jgi:hypothetical protein